MDRKKKLVFKILIIGDFHTGKTTFVNRYVHNTLCPTPRQLMMCSDYSVKFVKYGEDTVIRLNLFDIQDSQQRTPNMFRVFHREAVGCFILFDVTRGSTFEAATKWKMDLDNKVRLPDGNPVPCVLLANKCDLAKDGLVNDAQQMDEFCKDKGFSQWFEVSAKENINIEASTRFLIDEILKLPEEFLQDPIRDTSTNRSINLRAKPEPVLTASNCSSC